MYWHDNEIMREVQPWEDPFTDVPEASNDHDEIDIEQDVCRKVYMMPFDVDLVAILSTN